MKKFVLLSLLNFILLSESCFGPKVIPLKGSYQDLSYRFSTSLNSEQAYDKIIDFLTDHSIAVKNIDKANGLLISEKVNFIPNFSWENKKGQLTKPNAWVVASLVRDSFTIIPPNDLTITGQWVIRLKDEQGKTTVYTKLANASGRALVHFGNSDQEYKAYNLIVKSTGMFEHEIKNALAVR